MPPSTSNASYPATLRSVMLLTLLSLTFLPALVTAGLFGIPADLMPASLRTVANDGIGPFKMASLVLCPLGYFWIITTLAGKQSRRRDTVRYALRLQLQALFELLVIAIAASAAMALVSLVSSPTGLADSLVTLQQDVTTDHAALAVITITLATLPLSMLIAAWRLHALANTPGALAAAVNGTLCQRTLVVHNEIGAVRNELIRQLGRLTGAGTPGLGRVIYGSHPKLVSREVDGEVVHALAWYSCPTQLLVSCCELDDGSVGVHVRCALRGGFYAMYLVETPLDALAQMKYIDAHLLRPLTAQLAKLAAEQQRDTLRDQALVTQLRIMQAQIEPHFLFNTLANVRQLYRTSVADGESMMDHLIVYLRCAMEDLRADTSNVVKEMNLVTHYLSIMKIRMGERLSYRFAVAESLREHPFPPAMVISLVENAIRHGLVDCDHGDITMSASRDGDALRVTIADNGAGFSSVGGTGLGLSNIRQRLETMYGARAWLEVGAPAGGGFSATIVIPFQHRSS